MIIDAMDILYSGKVDGFCIVSSDDFTRLATRARSRMKVMVSVKKTPSPFIVACDKFIYLEIIGNPMRKRDGAARKPKGSGPIANRE